MRLTVAFRSARNMTVAVASMIGLVACGPSEVASSNVQGTSAPSAESIELFCPSPEEVERHWERYGEELKLDPDCPDPDPLPEPSDPEPPGSPPDEPTTLAEAQRLYDPENEPLILVEHQADGTYTSVTGTVLDPAFVPPPSIKTTDQYEKWLTTLPEQGR